MTTEQKVHNSDTANDHRTKSTPQQWHRKWPHNKRSLNTALHERLHDTNNSVMTLCRHVISRRTCTSGLTAFSLWGQALSLSLPSFGKGDQTRSICSPAYDMTAQLWVVTASSSALTLLSSVEFSWHPTHVQLVATVQPPRMPHLEQPRLCMGSTDLVYRCFSDHRLLPDWRSNCHPSHVHSVDQWTLVYDAGFQATVTVYLEVLTLKMCVL